MKPYFEKMADFGKALTQQQIKNAEGMLSKSKKLRRRSQRLWTRLEKPVWPQKNSIKEGR